MLWARYRRVALMIAADLAIVTVCYYLAFWLRLELPRLEMRYEAIFWRTLPWLLAIRLICGLLVRQHMWSFRHSSLAEAIGLIKAAAAGSLFFFAICQWGNIASVSPPRTVYFLEFFLSLAAMGALRFAPRYVLQIASRRPALVVEGEARLRTLIYGAGHTGELLLRDLLRAPIYPYEIIGFIDDAPGKWNVSIHGYRVLGSLKDLPEIIASHNIHKILIAIPSLPPARLREVVDLCSQHHVRLKIVPAYADLVMRGEAAPLALKDVQLEDLLERPEVQFDEARLAGFYAGKSALVTGAAGSIGSEICRQLAKHGVRQITAVDINENDLYYLGLDLAEASPRPSLAIEVANIRDFDRLAAIFQRYRPQLVFHAAAHKHVPLMEQCPGEAVRNNVFGTMNVARLADRCGSERFVLISTDKAIRPASVMGATKHLAEVLVRQMAKVSKTSFVAVRFGNVLG
ncbi:MAG: polysaccharide biosynthesis protein, partial [Planctomycetota bacterium]|nr:polysaccharide biosynthesis protein [Planctomycetota bacterium]